MPLSPQHRRTASPVELVESTVARIARAPTAGVKKGPLYMARRLREAERDIDRLTAAIEDHHGVPRRPAFHALAPVLSPLRKDLSAAIAEAEQLDARAISHNRRTGEPLPVDRVAPRELSPVRVGLVELRAALLELASAGSPTVEQLDAAGLTYDREDPDHEDREDVLERELKREIRRRGGWVQQSVLVDHCEKNQLCSRRTARDRLGELTARGELEKRTDPVDKRRNQYKL